MKEKMGQTSSAGGSKSNDTQVAGASCPGKPENMGASMELAAVEWGGQQIFCLALKGKDKPRAFTFRASEKTTATTTIKTI